MNILQINTADRGGGAEGSAYNLFRRFRELGHASWLAVGTKYRHDQDIFEIPRLPSTGGIRSFLFKLSELMRRRDKAGSPGTRKAARILNRLSSPQLLNQWRQGLEETAFPGCRQLLSILPAIPDVIHCHNLHGWYFDLELLPALSHTIPTILNLRDAWALTGHCAYFMDCQRWQTGCGDCPALNTYPALHKDNTRQNWLRKKQIYEASSLYVTAPSHWMLDLAKSSMLQAREYKVIPNGIDTSVFTPRDKSAARRSLNLPQDAPIVMFASASGKNIFKDPERMAQVMDEASQLFPDLHFLCIGGPRPQPLPNLHHFPYIDSPAKMALCYQAATLFIHTAKAEVFGKTITEAMACGTPVIASNVGGIPEQIIPEQNGFLATTQQDFIHALKTIMAMPPEQYDSMAHAAAAKGAFFSTTRQADTFLQWYKNIIHCNCSEQT